MDHVFQIQMLTVVILKYNGWYIFVQHVSYFNNLSTGREGLRKLHISHSTCHCAFHVVKVWSCCFQYRNKKKLIDQYLHPTYNFNDAGSLWRDSSKIVEWFMSTIKILDQWSTYCMQILLFIILVTMSRSIVLYFLLFYREMCIWEIPILTETEGYPSHQMLLIPVTLSCYSTVCCKAKCGV